MAEKVEARRRPGRERGGGAAEGRRVGQGQRPPPSSRRVYVWGEAGVRSLAPIGYRFIFGRLFASAEVEGRGDLARNGPPSAERLRGSGPTASALVRVVNTRRAFCSNERGVSADLPECHFVSWDFTGEWPLPKWDSFAIIVPSVPMNLHEPAE